MSGFAIGIIGGTGGIGRWFADLFAGEGHPVHVTGRREGLTLPELAAACPVVIVAVPIAATDGVIRRIGPLLPETSLLMDMTSLKAEPVRAMLEATKAEVLGSHPLFGPDVPSLAGQNLVLCPARGNRWLGRLETLFNSKGAHITVTTPEEHDRMMALVQGLTHLDTVLMGLALRDSTTDIEALEPFSTPIFRTKRAIIDKVFNTRPEMYAGILTGNPAMPELLDRYEENLARLKALVLGGDAAGLAALLKQS